MLLETIRAKKTKGTATFMIAANDALASVKRVADYVCDGIEDDVQIQAAIDALPAYPQGGSVVLSEGNFSIANSIDIRGSMKLLGQGVYLTRMNLAANCNMLVYDKGSQQLFFCLEGMFLDGIKATYSGKGLICNINLCDSYINRVFFGNFKEDTVYLGCLWGWVLNQTLIEWSEGNGLVLHAPGSAVKIIGCKIMGNEKNGIFARGGTAHVTNCELNGTDEDLNDTTYYVRLDCGDDVSDWDVGDSVRNDVGDGDDWTGTVYEISYLDNNDHIIVALAVGKDVDDIDLADGIENTTKSDTSTLDDKIIHQYCGFRSEGASPHNVLIGNRISGSSADGRREAGIYFASGQNVAIGNTLGNGHTGIYIESTSEKNRIIGNKFYGQSTYRIFDYLGSSYIKGNLGYVNECMEEITVTGDGAATTITLNHTLDADKPRWCDLIFTITALSQKMAEATYWISSVTSTQVVITFAAVLELDETYKFHIIGRFQSRESNLTVA